MRLLFGAVLFVFVIMSCNTEAPVDIGRAVLALSDVPDDVHCIRIDIRAPSRSLSQKLDVMPGPGMLLNLERLPLGEVVFSGEAFDASCAMVSAADSGAWSSDPVSVRVEAGQVAQIALVMKRSGRGLVDVTFDEDGEPPCPAGQSSCNNTCVSLDTDVSNCGACGRACEAGAMCSGGICSTMICDPGSTLCSGTCVDLQNDRNNCGSCGRQCRFMDELCRRGQCMLDCPSGSRFCGDACVNIESDPRNCGGCDRVCNSGEVCSQRMCMCPMGLVRCGGACVDPRSDEQNCGQCGQVCGPGTVCDGGACVMR